MHGFLDYFADPALILHKTMVDLGLSTTALIPIGVGLLIAAWFAKDFLFTKRGYR